MSPGNKIMYSTSKSLTILNGRENKYGTDLTECYLQGFYLLMTNYSLMYSKLQCQSPQCVQNKAKARISKIIFRKYELCFNAFEIQLCNKESE